MPKQSNGGVFCICRDPCVVWKRCVLAMYRSVDSLAKQPSVWGARKRGIASLDPETQQDRAILSALANKSRYTGNAVGLVRPLDCGHGLDG